MSRIVTDQMGYKVAVPDRPLRIISVVPSQTELLFDLGLDAEIVGVTRFCIHPRDRSHAIERIGGTKDFDIEKIKTLNPDLVIGNKEENYEEGINELKKCCPVWMSAIETLYGAYEMMALVGDITVKAKEAEKIVNEIKQSFASMAIEGSKKSCAYFIWRKPYMVAAKGTFIDHMLGIYGVKNAFDGVLRYPEVTMEMIRDADPELIFLSSEPYSFSDRHKAEFQEICPNATIHIVDGEMFSWYGSRLRHTAAYFGELRKKI